MQFQWYPGHMTKARRAMQEDIKLVDLVIELVDSRVPLASRNPDIDELGKNKARLVIMNKSDLADEKINKQWEAAFREKGYYVVMMDSRSSAGKAAVQKVIAEACRAKIERDRRRGILNRPVRAMVVGIPNVGKSTFINSIAGKACAKTGNKPGVTRGNQWIRLNKQVELLDTPGILWPKFEDQTVGLKLAMIGSIKDDIINTTELGLEVIRFLMGAYPLALSKRYGIEAQEEGAEYSSVDILTMIAEAKNCRRQGNELDLDRMAMMIVDDFRSGRLGKVSVERPEENAGETARQ
ncbi:MAG: ribosome biogenesis GTPase YlqF [Lachnospiraceae bacterium]|nr:ribosome biogenesis GTPase YlqF [Lachnospiraceae bacterium]